jgi:hypothetical protein
MAGTGSYHILCIVYTLHYNVTLLGFNRKDSCINFLMRSGYTARVNSAATDYKKCKIQNVIHLDAAPGPSKENDPVPALQNLLYTVY